MTRTDVQEYKSSLTLIWRQASCLISTSPSTSVASHFVKSPSRQNRKSTQALPTSTRRNVKEGNQSGKYGSIYKH